MVAEKSECTVTFKQMEELGYKIDSPYDVGALQKLLREMYSEYHLPVTPWKKIARK